MVALGNWLFHNRNWLFPLFYLLLFVPSPQVLADPCTALWIGLITAAVGQMIRNLTLGLVYIGRGGQDRQIHANELYTRGLMAHARNPLYIGNILVLLGLGIASNSWFFLGIVFPIFVIFYQAIVLAEENYLEGQFGEAYRQYKSKINRWLPKHLDKLGETFGTMEFKWPRVIVAEYNQMFLWMTGGLGLIAMHYYRNPERFNFEAAKPYLLLAFAVLVVLYLTARYLKKSKRLTAD